MPKKQAFLSIMSSESESSGKMTDTNLRPPLAAYGTSPKGAMLLKRTGTAGLRPAPSGERYFEFNSFFRDHNNKTFKLIKNNEEKLLVEHTKELPNTFYISPRTKGCEQPNEPHLGADRLLERKPMICNYSLATFFHKELVEALLAEDIRPAKGGYIPVTFTTEDGSFENTDYFRLDIGAIAKPEFWCSGHIYNIFEYENSSPFPRVCSFQEDSQLTPAYLPISYVIKEFPEGDFWYASENVKGIFSFCMSSRARAIIERFKSPHKKYQLQIFGDLYNDIQDTPLTAQMRCVFGTDTEFAVLGTSRKLNPGETIPDFLAKHVRYKLVTHNNAAFPQNKNEPSITRIDGPLPKYQQIPPLLHPEYDAYQDEAFTQTR